MSTEPFEKVNRKRIKEIIFKNFIGGIAWGLGATIGVSIIITLLSLIMKQVNLIPVIGNFVSQITSFVLQNNPHLVK